MRKAMVIVALLGWFWPATAEAGSHFRECRRMTKQIDHYEGVVGMARERDNELWEDATLDHISRLEHRRAKLCPQYKAQLDKRKRVAKAKKDTQKMMRTAAKIAARYFTFGAY